MSQGAPNLLDRTVTSVEQKDVPAALLLLPAGYRDATVKPGTAQTPGPSNTQRPAPAAAGAPGAGAGKPQS